VEADVSVPFAQHPKIPLATLPTPLSVAARLREALGGRTRCPRLLIKRDDLTGLALGGNKARKLEFLVADAMAKDATVIITTGAVQSNHARMTAAAACAAGLRTELILTGDDVTPPFQGNLLLDWLFGATLHFLPPPADPTLATNPEETAKVIEVEADLRARGERPYVIPIGGSSAVGVLGYLSASAEIAEQLREQHETAARLYYASGSRGTQAGLTLGAKRSGASYEVYGVAVSGGEPWKRERALRIAKEAAALAGIATRLSEAELSTDQTCIGAGYGIPTPECLEAIHLVAKHEGILLDPVYTAKAMACLIGHVRSGDLDPASTLIFLHTGGVPALFAHGEALAASGGQGALL
jgi:D-cysteine desulfhydrase family pyridoxal phosphate-dependent enzyme